MTNMDQDEHECNRIGCNLTDGDKVLFNDRSRPLAVVGRHKRKGATSSWRYRGVEEYHDVIELAGNGTEYHLICTGGSEHGPMLYKEVDWDEDKTNKIGLSPKYSRMGERVESMVVTNRSLKMDSNQ